MIDVHNALFSSFSFLLRRFRVILKQGIEYVSDPGLLRSRRPLPCVFMSGLVDDGEEVHKGNEDTVGGIASTREDFGDMIQCVEMLHQSKQRNYGYAR